MKKLSVLMIAAVCALTLAVQAGDAPKTKAKPAKAGAGECCGTGQQAKCEGEKGACPMTQAAAKAKTGCCGEAGAKKVTRKGADNVKGAVRLAQR